MGIYDTELIALRDFASFQTAYITQLHNVIARLSPAQPAPTAVEAVRVDAQFLSNSIYKYLSTLGVPVASAHFVDAAYWLCSRQDFDVVVREDATERAAYLVDRFDCDDFAHGFRAAVSARYGVTGIAYVEGPLTTGGVLHAFNLVVFSDGVVALFEPQADQYVEPLSGGLYDLAKGGLIEI